MARVDIKVVDSIVSFDTAKSGLVRKGSFWRGRSVTLYGQKLNRSSLINALNAKSSLEPSPATKKLKKGSFGFGGADKKQIKKAFDDIYLQSKPIFRPNVTDWLTAEDGDFLSKVFENAKIDPVKVRLVQENHPGWENPSILREPLWSRIPRRDVPFGNYKLLIPLTFTDENTRSKPLRCFVAQEDGEWKFVIDNFPYSFEKSFVRNLLQNGQESVGSRTWRLAI